MPYENCDECRKCFPCPVTSGDKKEGAYPIAQGTGNIWYCTSCFYCEDICPEYSPRQYAIDKRRKEDCETQRMIEPLDQLSKHGSLFPITSGINELRSERSLPLLPKPNQDELEILFNNLMHPKNKQTISKADDTSYCDDDTKIAFFLGCLIPYRVYSYEKSARWVLDALNVKYCDLPFACCGSVMAESHSEDLWLASAAYNLAIAEEQNIETIITLCGGCAGNLRRVNQLLSTNSELLSKVNTYLLKIGKTYRGSLKVEHLSEFLLKKKYTDELQSLLKTKLVTNLKRLKIGIQVPCQVIRPTKSSPSIMSESNLMRKLLQPLKLDIADYPFETLCCGSSMLQYDVPLAHKIAKKRIDALKKRKVDALILGCGNCSMNYTIHQSEYNDELIPTLFFTEILAYALGYQIDKISHILD
jgi:heterodisulfide reductase subunit B